MRLGEEWRHDAPEAFARLLVLDCLPGALVRGMRRTDRPGRRPCLLHKMPAGRAADPGTRRAGHQVLAARQAAGGLTGACLAGFQDRFLGWEAQIAHGKLRFSP